MSIASKLNLLIDIKQSIKTAIENNTKTDASNDLTTYADLINSLLDTSYKSEHVNLYGIWEKPEEWPDIESLPLPDDGSDVLYMLIDTEIEPYGGLNIYPYSTAGNNIVLSLGTIENGEFVAFNTRTVKSSKNITCNPITNYNNGNRYIIAKLFLADTSAGKYLSKVTLSDYTLPATGEFQTTAKLASSHTPILMYYGRLLGGIALPTATNYTESINILDYALAITDTNITVSLQCLTLCRLRLDNNNVSNNNLTTLSFYGCRNLSDVGPLLDLTGWVGSGVTTLKLTFLYCESLKVPINVSNWDISNVTTMERTFSLCVNVPEIIGITTWTNTSKVTTLIYTFETCSRLSGKLDLSNFTGKITNMTYTFINCYNLQSIDISSLDLTALVSLANTFYRTYNLQTINWPTEKIPSTATLTNVSYAFLESSVKEIDFTGWDLSKVSNPHLCLLYLSLGETAIFKSPNTTSVTMADTNSGYAAARYSKVKYLDASFIDASKCSGTYLHSIGFRDMSYLLEFYPPINICKSFYFNNYSANRDSLLRIINNLSTVTTATTLTIGTFNRAKLTDEELAVAVDKGWTVA